MKSHFNIGVGTVLALAASMFSGFSASADVKLSIPDFTVSNYKEVPVEITLDNSVPIMGYSFNIELPAGLEIVTGSVEKTDRFNQGQTLSFRNNIFGCVSMQEYNFFGESGAVGTFKVRYTGTLPTTPTTVDIKLTNISITAQDFADNVFIPEQTTTVTLIDNTDPVVLTLSADPQSFLINPGGVQEIAVAIDNNRPIQGMQMNIVLPDGFTFQTYGGNIFEQTPRMNGGATITPKTTGNTTRVVIADMMNNLVLDAGSGDFMKFKVIAPSDFKDETASIVFNNVQASVDFRTEKIDDTVSIAMTNGLTAYNNAMAEIGKLETSLADALAEIATACPDVKDQFPGTELAEQINTLKANVEEAYADMTLTDNYATVMAPVSEIENGIAELVSEAKAAQKAHEEAVAAEQARQEAYANANAVVADLEKQYADAIETIATDCPDVKDQFQGQNISAAIEQLKAAIEKAYEDKTIAPDYDNLIAPKADIEAAIALLVADATAAQTKHNEEVAAEQARQEAYANANAVVAVLEKELNDALTTIATECPDVKNNFKGDTIKNSIQTLKNAIRQAYDNKTIAADYDNVIAPKSDIESAIANLLADAKEAQKKHDDEVAAAAAAEQARQEAYANANAVLSALEQQLAQALSTIATECPDVKDNFNGKEISTQIASLKNAIQNAYDNKTIATNYDNVIAPKGTIETEIAQLLSEAQAAQKKHDDEVAAAAAAEQARQEAYANANAIVSSLEQQLAQALSTIATECPDVKDNFNGKEISTQIASLKKDIQNAYDNKTIATNYHNVVAPKAGIESAIAQMVTDAKASQKAFEENAAAEKARQEAYANANAVVAGLEQQLAQALSTIATDCPDVKDNFKGDTIKNSIQDLKYAIKQAYDNKTIVANYDNVVAPKAGIEASIAQLVSDAQEAQKKHDDEVAAAAAAEKARQEAYANANAVVSALEQQLAQALSTIATECPDVKDNFNGKEISTQIASLKKDIQNAYDNKTIATNYDNVIAPKAGIESAIVQMVTDAKASQKAFEENAALESARLKANTEIASLDQALANALAEIAKECPDVATRFTGTDIQQKITVLRNAVTNAYDAKTLADKYDEVMAPVAGINADIVKLVDDAKAAQKKADDDAAADKALAEAYAKANAELANLDMALANALTQIASECPDVKHLYTGTAIQQMITVLRNAVKTAYDDKSLTAKYDEVMAPVAGINADIAKLIEDAKAAQKKVDDETAAQKALADAYNNALGTINDLRNKLNDALSTIATECPDVKDNFNGEEIEKNINSLKEDIKDAYADKTLVDNYDNILAPATGIENAINDMIDKAQEEQKKIDDEIAAQKALDEANVNANDRIKELREKLAEALETIATDCPDVKDNFNGEEIEKNINSLKEDIKDAYADKTLVDNYDNILAPATDIETAIEKLIDEAKAAQKAADEAEAARQAENKAAYEADLEQIDELKDALNDAIEKIRADYPGYAYTSEANAITTAINDQKSKADAEYERVAEEGSYSTQVDAAAIEEMIQTMLDNADKNSGIITINGEDLTDQDRIFSIDGKELPCAQPGKVNIIIKADGRRIKAYVK